MNNIFKLIATCLVMFGCDQRSKSHSTPPPASPEVTNSAATNHEGNESLVELTPVGEMANARLVWASQFWTEDPNMPLKDRPRIEVLFLFKEADGALIHCHPKDFTVEPVNRWVNDPNSMEGCRDIEPDHTIHLEPQMLHNDNVYECLGVEYSIVEPGYDDSRVSDVLLMGREYRIWCSEYGKYTQFRIPPKINEQLNSLRLLWIVNEGTLLPDS